MRDLTKAEEEIMQILWDLGEATVWDVIAKMPEPKPAYNTISTFIRILEQKGFIDHATYGKTHSYFPMVERQMYRTHEASKLMHNYFEGSVKNLVSFFVQDQNLSMTDADEIIRILQQSQTQQ